MQNYLHLDILPEAAKFTGKEIATILEHITNLLTYGEDEQKSNPFPFKWPQALSERLEQNERLLLQELSLKDRFTMFVADPIDTYIKKLTLVLILREQKSPKLMTFLADTEEALIRRLGLLVFGAVLARFWKNNEAKKMPKMDGQPFDFRMSFAGKTLADFSVATATELALNSEILKCRSKIRASRLFKPISSDGIVKSVEEALAKYFHFNFGAMFSVELDAFYLFGKEFCQ